MVRLSLLCIGIAGLCAAEYAIGTERAGSAQIILNDKHCIERYKIENIFNLFGSREVGGVEIGQALGLSERDKKSLNQRFQVLTTDDAREVALEFQDRPFSVKIEPSYEIGKRYFSLKLVETKAIL